jgi:hypothetical protein
MAKERLLYRCPVCSRISTSKAFEAGERGEHTTEVMVCRYVGGGRSGRPKVEARDDDGNVIYKRDGKPLMVLKKGEDGKPEKGRGMEWSRRDLDPIERGKMVSVLRAVANRESDELMRDVLMSAHDDDFEELAGAYEQELLEEIAARQQLINSIKKKRYFGDDDY